MGFFKNLFGQAVEIDRLNRQCTFLTAALEREQDYRILAEKQLVAERRAKDKFMLRYCDQISQKAGLYGNFTKDVEVPETKTPELPFDSPFEQQRIEWAATEMRNADIAADIEPRPIETYIEIIKQDPNRYIIL